MQHLHSPAAPTPPNSQLPATYPTFSVFSSLTAPRNSSTMTEPFGTAADIIGVLQLTGRLVSLGYDYMGGVRDAPKEP